MSAQNRELDVSVRYYGTIATFELKTQAAEDWWKRSVFGGWIWGNRQVVEPRFAEDIREAIEVAGLVLVEETGSAIDEE